MQAALLSRYSRTESGYRKLVSPTGAYFTDSFGDYYYVVNPKVEDHTSQITFVVQKLDKKTGMVVESDNSSSFGRFKGAG